ncbi:MAG: protein-methionine-sulfoxide reductase catalytic subunit MsrP [Alphaproteobacteria bacterium]|nr:protein-methionine-sulfoxide reductase catalytic subunit MsrP [Alphaproteobacteria bacterium]
MLIKRPRGWEIKEARATPEAVFHDRRRVAQALGLGSILAGIGEFGALGSALADEADPSAGLYPAKQNPAYTVAMPLTPEDIATKYNNFYEFGSHKQIASAAQELKTRPWTVKIEGMVEKPMEVGIDNLLKAMPLEERLYRHRCVEAWSMKVPWSGFALKALVDYAKPLGSAKYLEMYTFVDVKMAPGQRSFWYPWPYVDGLTMAEATSEMAFIATGLYGKPIHKQNGAPLRLAVPWKYGFKSVKSIVRFAFTDKRPKGFWEQLQASEYGFWANVNPEVPHPRWSQAQETDIGTQEKIPTLLFNGYAEQVAGIYKGLEKERLWA